MADIIVILILAVIVSLACVHIYKNNKKGIKCMGCPYYSSCDSKSCDKTK